MGVEFLEQEDEGKVSVPAEGGGVGGRHASDWSTWRGFVHGVAFQEFEAAVHRPVHRPEARWQYVGKIKLEWT